MSDNHTGVSTLYQPDGTKLTKASLIRPGWVLRMPGDASGPGIQTIARHLGHDHQAPRPVQEYQHRASHGGAGMAVAHLMSTVQEASRQVWPAELAAASLLAAGVLSALGRRRRERVRRRGPARSRRGARQGRQAFEGGVA